MCLLNANFDAVFTRILTELKYIYFSFWEKYYFKILLSTFFNHAAECLDQKEYLL